MNSTIKSKRGMASQGKLLSFVFGIIVLGALASTTFGYFTNITDSLTSAGFGWAGTLIVIGIVIGLVKLFVPKK